MSKLLERRAICAPFFVLIPIITSCSTGSYSSDPQVRSHQHETSERLSEMENRILELTSRLEELEYEKFAKSNKKQGINDVKREEPLKILPSIQEKPRLAPALKLNQSSIIPKDVLNSDKEMSFSLSTESGQAFLKALELVELGEFQTALPLINEAYDLNYKKPNSAKILFWKGVIYEARRENKKAITLYSEIVNTFPNDTRSRESLLRQASIFTRLREPELAKVTYQKLMNDYPGTKEAIRAKEKLKDL